MKVYDEEERSLKNIVVAPEPCIVRGCGNLAYPGKKCPSCSQSKDPDRCPVCLARWDYFRDELGRVYPVHPVTKCVPKPRIVVDHSWDDALDVRECKDCHGDFPVFKGQQLKVYCDPCRVIRNETRNRQSALVSKREAA